MTTLRAGPCHNNHPRRHGNQQASDLQGPTVLRGARPTEPRPHGDSRPTTPLEEPQEEPQEEPLGVTLSPAAPLEVTTSPAAPPEAIWHLGAAVGVTSPLAAA